MEARSLYQFWKTINDFLYAYFSKLRTTVGLRSLSQDPFHPFDDFGRLSDYVFCQRIELFAGQRIHPSPRFSASASNSGSFIALV